MKRLSGDEVISLLARFGFEVHSQRGSHVKLIRVNPEGHREILTIPRHRELDTGTLQAVYRQASRFVSNEELRKVFYVD